MKIIYAALGISLLSACSQTKETVVNVPTGATEVLTSGTFDPNFMDKSVRPQDDFFTFANGMWIQNNPIPSSESRWGSFNELDQSNKTKLKEILNEAAASSSDPKTDKGLLGNYYASFINMDARNKAGIIDLKSELYEIQSMTSERQLPAIVANQHLQGIHSLFNFGVDQDLKNINRNISYFSQGGLSLPNKDYYSNENKATIRAEFVKYVTRIFELAGNDPAECKKSADLVMGFETALASKMLAPAELRIPEKNYNKWHKKDLVKAMSTFDFNLYLQKLGAQAFDTVIVGQVDFTNNMTQILSSQSLDAWKAYLTFKTLNKYAAHLDERFMKERFLFYEGVLSGKTEMKPLDEQAINELTNMSIGEVLGKLFVEKNFSQKSQDRVNQMVDNLLATFEERIKALTWMTSDTKKEALHKLKSIGRKLGFPSKWEDFSDLKLTKDNYLQNVKMCAIRDTKKSLAELNKPIDKEKWGMPAHMVNAYYHPLLNEIAFPAGIMQAPFFEENGEDALNYGRIGMVIGHEFVHGFDDMGSKFAADGSFSNWWSEKDRKAFEDKTALLGATFAGFCPIDGHCVNPDLTMGENIADLGGITLAYHAYMKTDEFKARKIINGFNPSQRFFLCFAQLWKISYTEEELKNRIANDPHSPGMYRVNGPLMNCPEFFEAFGVKEGDPMRNADAKVARIW